jgi:hypothetical protein
MPSSKFISNICAPFSTCSLAICSASSYLLSLIRRKNFLDPATLHRSPILTKFVSFLTLNGSKPHKTSESSFTFDGGIRGGRFFTFSAIAL